MHKPRPFVDLHLHAEGLSDTDLSTLALFGLVAAVTCAHDTPGPRAEDVKEHWDELVQIQVKRLSSHGIRPLVALGLHPARIPWQGTQELLHELPRYFNDPRVAALGELGFSEGTPREEEVLLAQLELARQIRKPVIIHTPAIDKLMHTRRLLSLVKESRVEAEKVLLDHNTAETLPLVRALGFWAGLTVQPGGLDAVQASAILKKHGADGVVLTSDVGDGASDLLALPRAAEALLSAGLSEALCRRALHDGPMTFLRLPEIV
ncbi:MAG: TatD family hydrolase [Deltaproteobacteria bacterium]|nr:TatD family hydrolase [Deltaproteobacteria bacterium]